MIIPVEHTPSRVKWLPLPLRLLVHLFRVFDDTLWRRAALVTTNDFDSRASQPKFSPSGVKTKFLSLSAFTNDQNAPSYL
jgi:hypothetical protein